MPRIQAASIREQRALTRRALLDAARDLIAEAGTAQIPLGEVALAAGVGRTTFYEYFSSRDDVIAALVEEQLPRVVSELIASVPEDQPVERRLAELACRTVEFVANDRVCGIILHREVGRMGQEAQQRIGRSHAELSSELTELYARGVDQGVFRRLPPELAAGLIQDTIMSAARVLIQSEADIEEVTEGLRSFLLGGLATGPSAG